MKKNLVPQTLNEKIEIAPEYDELKSTKKSYKEDTQWRYFVLEHIWNIKKGKHPQYIWTYDKDRFEKIKMRMGPVKHRNRIVAQSVLGSLVPYGNLTKPNSRTRNKPHFTHDEWKDPYNKEVKHIKENGMGWDNFIKSGK